MSSNSSGAFVPTTNVWDVDEIYSTDVTSEEFKELLVRLNRNLNTMSIAINVRDAGIYDTIEFICGKVYFPDPSLTSASSTTPTQRPVYRKVFNFGALPNTASKNLAHGITVTDTLIFTDIFGTAKRQTPFSSIKLPCPGSTVAGEVQLEVVGENICVTTAGNYSAWATTYITLEYLK